MDAVRMDGGVDLFSMFLGLCHKGFVVFTPTHTTTNTLKNQSCTFVVLNLYTHIHRASLLILKTFLCVCVH